MFQNASDTQKYQRYNASNIEQVEDQRTIDVPRDRCRLYYSRYLWVKLNIRDLELMIQPPITTTFDETPSW